MVGEVVVIFDGLEGGAFAEETEVVDGDVFREEGLDGLVDVSDLGLFMFGLYLMDSGKEPECVVFGCEVQYGYAILVLSRVCTVCMTNLPTCPTQT